MQQLPSSLTDKTNGFQKLIAFGIMAGAIYVGALAINAYMPAIIEAFKNIWIAIFLGAPLGLVTVYCITNPLVVWGFFKTLSWNFTKFLIKMDPLSVMDRYLDYLKNKYKSLGRTIEVLRGKKSYLEQKIQDRKTKVETNRNNAIAAKKQNKPTAAGSFMIKVKTDEQALASLQPLYERVSKNLEFLGKLSDNWGTSIENLGYQIEGKRDEYEIIKETYKGLKTAEDFINSDSDSARLYGESIKALQEEVTQKIGYIEEFERKSKKLNDTMDIEKQALEDEGMKELEEMLTSGNLMLPEFTTTEQMTVVSSTVKQPQTVSSKKKYTFNN